MNDFFLFRELPWTRSLVDWLLAAVLLFASWVIIGIGAHLILDIIRSARDELAALSSRLAQRDEVKAARLVATLHSSFDSFLNNHLLTEIVSLDERLCKKVAGGIEVLRSELPSVPQSLDANYQELRRTAIHAGASLFFSSLLVLAIMTVNTFLLTRILQELGIGLFSLIGGLRLYHVLAALLTLIEAGMGIWHGHAQTRSAGRPALSISEVLPYFGAISLALVEGFYYSRLAQSATTRPLSFLGFQFGFQEAFFLLGFVLPITLFALGSIAFQSLIQRRLANEPAKLVRLAQHLRGDLLALETQLSTTATVAQTFPAAQSGYRPVELPRAARIQHAFRVGIALLFTIGLAVFVIHIHILVLPGSNSLNASMAIVKVLGLISIGMLLLRPPSFLILSGNLARPIYDARVRWLRILGTVLVLTVIAYDVSQIATVAIDEPDRSAWAAAIVSEAMLAILGRLAHSMLALLLAVLSSLSAAIAILAIWIRALLLHILVWTFTAIHFLARLLAAPILWFTRHRAPREVAP